MLSTIVLVLICTTLAVLAIPFLVWLLLLPFDPNFHAILETMAYQLGSEVLKLLRRCL